MCRNLSSLHRKKSVPAPACSILSKKASIRQDGCLFVYFARMLTTVLKAEFAMLFTLLMAFTL